MDDKDGGKINVNTDKEINKVTLNPLNNQLNKHDKIIEKKLDDNIDDKSDSKSDKCENIIQNKQESEPATEFELKVENISDAELEDKMVEITENQAGANWNSDSYSEAMKKFRDTCLRVKKMEKHLTDDEKENVSLDGSDTNVNVSADEEDSTLTQNKFYISKSEKNPERKSCMPEDKNEIEAGSKGRCLSMGEENCKNGNSIDRVQACKNSNSDGNPLTEKNLEMFSKMCCLPYNSDVNQPATNSSPSDLRCRLPQDDKHESCQSADESVASKYDSENDLTLNNSHNPQLMKALLDSKSDMMRFAEVLYKCTLCTNLPSIFISKSSFVKHFRECHFTMDSLYKICKICSLKFKTSDDLRRHEVCIHSGSDRLSPMETGSDVIRPRFCSTGADNESDSDSSGHRSYKAKVGRRSKPTVPDFENPKQLVDHAGIETLNGSLDLSKKDTKPLGNKNDTNNSVFKTQHEGSSPHSLNEKSAFNVQQITDQIMQSNLHGRNMQPQSDKKLPFTPSYTPEFGKFTKLVREGGNIVYFCQVCNWMSPVKAHFAAHCGSVPHSKKVKSTNDQEQGGENTNKSDSSASKDTNSPLSKNPNVCIGGYEMKHSPGSHPGILNIPSTSTFSKLHEASMFYSYIRPRNLTHCGRTPVVSGQGFHERSDFLFQKHGEKGSLLSNMPLRKRKRPRDTICTTLKGGNSESDSEDVSVDKEHLSRCSSASMSLLRNKLLQGHTPNEKMSSGSVKDSISRGENCQSLGAIERTDMQGETFASFGYSDENKADRFSNVAKHSKNCNEFPVNRDLPHPAKHRKREESECNDRDETEHSLFKLYRCVSCPFEYSNLDEYEQHFSKVHIASSQSEGFPKSTFQHLFSSLGSDGLNLQGHSEGHTARTDLGGSGGNVEMGENWRVQKLKEILPDFLEVNEKGNTSRDFLLQCICISSGIPDAALWSSACNKAVREVFPSSLAQRKGKYKKTYYFGLSMSESFQGQEDLNPLDPDGQIYQPIRDINADMEKIMEQLPTIIHWNGCMDSGVYRADILSVLEDLLDEPDVLSWGTQCNRAIKLVFPMVDMKRKGKFKTTKYFGVSFNKNIGQIPSKPDLNSSIAELSSTREEKQEKEKCDDVNEHSGETTHTKPIDMNSNSSKDVNMEPASTDNCGSLVPVFPQWFKEEAQSQMEQYLTKFGGVVDETSGKTKNKVEDDDNDGDDEGESIDETTSV